MDMSRPNSIPPADGLQAATQAQIDAALAVLQAHRAAWIALGVPERLAILDEISADMVGVAERWVDAGLRAKGLVPRTPGAAEEWLFLATILRSLRMLRQTLAEIQRTGRPRHPDTIRAVAWDQLAARVIPRGSWDRLVFRGITGEVWMQEGITREDIVRDQARGYRELLHTGKVVLVLGAGNASMLSVIDVVHKLFVEDHVVALKPNPVNAYLGPLLEESLRALIRRGFLRILQGGPAEGRYLCDHPSVDELHLTGSHHTFEAITFGTGAAGEHRKRMRTPLNNKRFTCELGNVSPIIVVPGPWRTADIEDQAEQIVTWYVANAGFGCLNPRVLIQHSAWNCRDQLLDAVERLLERTATREAYYPGASERHALFSAGRPTVRHIGRTGGGHLPWTLIPHVDPASGDDICFRQEAFCSIIAETGLEAASVTEFLDRAVDFANTTLWGTLCATLIVHPASLDDPHIAAAVERAIARLRYGAITVNMAAFAAYYFQVAPWGGFPGHTIDDIQSGIGKTANYLMFEHSQKSVVRGPFRKRFDPLRITSHRTDEFARRLAYFEAAPALAKLPGLVWTALRA